MTSTRFALWVISFAHLPLGWSATGLHSLQEVSPALWSDGAKNLFPQQVGLCFSYSIPQEHSVVGRGWDLPAALAMN